MKTALFDFALPKDRIALRPAAPRDSARMLCVAPGRFDDLRVSDLPARLRPGDLLVVNDTRVVPARLSGRRGEARIEATLHQRLDGARWRAFARPAKRLAVGQTVEFGAGFAAVVRARGERGEVVLDFGLDDAAFDAALARCGAAPLPPYIERPGGPDARDAVDYQTVFARRPGAVAAPTAGLHFTPGLLDRLEAAGIGRAAVTLHVGAGTFRPVVAEDTRGHRLHAEWGEVGAAAARAVARTRAAGGRVVAVGTTGLLDRLEAAGIGRAAVTLHVGAGTFRPVVAEDTRGHRLHAEWGEVGAAAARAVARTRAAGGRVVAVGTTAARLLETAAAADGVVRPFAGETDLFIAPGYRFRAVDALLTNFHLPRSSLFMLVCAFSGLERMRAAYAHAVERGYRFYSYGDACLLRPAADA